MNEKPKKSSSQGELDSLVVNIELTLISIIQGVALYFLTENSRRVLVDLQYIYWPYLAVGLLMIFTFWSRSILHTFTLIRWPLEFGHNFVYITCTLLEAATFTQVDQPLHWYALQTAFSSAVWFLFAWDFRMIRRRIEESRKEASRELFAQVRKDQLLNICLLMPATVAFCGVALGCLCFWPKVFLDRGFHVFFALAQGAVALGYLIYGIRSFNRSLALVTQTRLEWNED
jgi:hypothetical protein